MHFRISKARLLLMAFAVAAMSAIIVAGAYASSYCDDVARTDADPVSQGDASLQPSQDESLDTLGTTPFDAHGALSVHGRDLVDASGQRFQLHGVSTHGLAWYPQYVNRDAFKTLRDDWNANVVRLAMYTAEYGGYCTGGNQQDLKNLVCNGVDIATELGMYVIVDWHVMNEDANPMKYINEAKSFFSEMSSRYSDHDNVIYEICNEPCNSTTWGDVKGYASQVIPIIRANDGNAVILVGTPQWCQSIDEAANDRLPFDNVMYSLHFYAATHTQWLRDRYVSAYDAGLPIFISEFDICDASGGGYIDYGEGEKWFDLIDRYNTSYCKWNLSNKDEASSAIASNCQKTGGWSEGDLSATGRWIYDKMRSEDDFDGNPPATPTPTPPPGFIADPQNGVFYDTVGHWVESEGVIRQVVKYGLMNGYRDNANALTGYFGPDDLITRGQVASVLYRMSGAAAYPETNQTPCVDVQDNQYFTAAINWAYENGVMSGYMEGGICLMKPDQHITRSEFAKMVFTAASHFGCNMEVERPWDIWQASDAWRIEDWARPAFEWCYAYRVATGNSQTGELKPQDNATRAEGAKMFVVLYSLI